MNATYQIDWANGDPTEDHYSYDAAKQAVLAQYPDAEIGHDGDLESLGDRTLCWPDEASSVNDAGERAVAAIRRIEE